MSRQTARHLTVGCEGDNHAVSVAAIKATRRALSNSRDHLSRWADHIELRRSAGLDVAEDEADLALSIAIMGSQTAALDRRSERITE